MGKETDFVDSKGRNETSEYSGSKLNTGQEVLRKAPLGRGLT